jgi:hypothetical protein
MTKRPQFVPGGSFWLSVALCLGPSLAVLIMAAEDRPQPPVEAYEWSVWVSSPAQTSLNASRNYRNAMPSVVGTSRPKLEPTDLAGKFPIAPISVVQFFGDPYRDIDIDLRVKKGTLLSHWPPAAERTGRVQWFKSDLVQSIPPGVPMGFLPDDHWLQKLRRVDSALYHKRESRAERFLAYDAEVAITVPLKLRGGPEEYTLQNLTGHKLLDVAVIVPTNSGYRVGWLDELPTAVPDTSAETKAKDDAKKKKKSAGEQAKEVFDQADADAKKDDERAKKKEEPKPLPAEGDANVRARVDQILNRTVTVNVDEAPRSQVLDAIAGQARFRYELDDKTLAKADVDLTKTMSLKAANVAARDALADVLGSVGLTYRVTEDGTLFITTAARLADESGKKGAAIEGPPVKLTLSQPLKPDHPSYRELTRDSYTRRLTRQGLREEVQSTLLDQYGKALFTPNELIVLVHFSREALDEVVLLDVFPETKKFVRSALLVMHGVDPRLQDRARALVKKLGDKAPKVRETAESQLFALGPVVVPVLEDALRDDDLEIVFRAERLLLKLNRQVP